jgi:hypothetical protein
MLIKYKNPRMYYLETCFGSKKDSKEILKNQESVNGKVKRINNFSKRRKSFSKKTISTLSMLLLPLNSFCHTPCLPQSVHLSTKTKHVAMLNTSDIDSSHLSLLPCNRLPKMKLMNASRLQGYRQFL